MSVMWEMELSDAERAFRDELRGWLAEHLVDDYRAASGLGGPDDDAGWDVRRAWDRELGAGGWIGVTWPREVGGRGGNLAHEVIVQVELAAAGAPSRGAFHGETLLAPTLLGFGTAEQKARYLPDMAAGRVVWCQGYSEPGAGSDLAGVSTRATKVDGGWSITGQKIWTTFAHHASRMFALVRSEPGSVRHAGLSYVLIDMDQAGVEVRPIRTLTDDSAFNEVFLDDVFVPDDDVVGEPGNGWRVAMSTLGHERATSVLGHQFSFVRELDLLHDVMRENRTWDDLALRDRFALASNELDVIRANNLRVLAAAGDGEFGPEASIGKYLWSSWHQRFTELVMEVLGHDGLRADIEDRRASELRGAYLRSRAETIYAGTSQIQLNILAERVLGLPR